MTFPNFLISQLPHFLLFLALASTAFADVTFVDVAASSGLDFQHTDGKSGKRLFNEFLASGGGFRLGGGLIPFSVRSETIRTCHSERSAAE